jgi:hypothetical protein
LPHLPPLTLPLLKEHQLQLLLPKQQEDQIAPHQIKIMIRVAALEDLWEDLSLVQPR